MLAHHGGNAFRDLEVFKFDFVSTSLLLKMSFLSVIVIVFSIAESWLGKTLQFLCLGKKYFLFDKKFCARNLNCKNILQITGLENYIPLRTMFQIEIFKSIISIFNSLKRDFKKIKIVLILF